MSDKARLPYELRLQIGKALDRLVCEESTPEQVDSFISTFADFGLTITPTPVVEMRGDLDDETIVRIARRCFNEKYYDLLTYEKSPPMFPQATYDVPTYALQLFVKAVRAAATEADHG